MPKKRGTLKALNPYFTSTKLTALLRTTFFGEGKHGQAPAEHFLSCVSFQHVHSVRVLPESVKAYSFNLNDSSFVGQFLSSFFAFFITPSLRPFNLFSHFTWVSNEDNDAQSESFLLILKMRLLCFQSQQKFKEEQSFPWGECLTAVRATVKRQRSQWEGSDNVAFVLGATAAVLLHFSE